MPTYFDDLNRVAQMIVLESIRERDWPGILGQPEENHIELHINNQEIDINLFALELERQFDLKVHEEAKNIAMNIALQKNEIYLEAMARLNRAHDYALQASANLDNAYSELLEHLNSEDD